MIRTSRLILAIALLFVLTVHIGAAQAPTLTNAGIVFGDCATPDFEFALQVPSEPAGQPIGSPDAVRAGKSFSGIPVTLDVLIQQDAAIVLLDEFASPVACGPIGGVPEDDGSLAVGLAPVDGSGVMGVAYLMPDGPDLVISLFTASPGSGFSTILATGEIDGSPIDTEPITDVDAGSGIFSAEELAYASDLIFVIETMSNSLDQVNQLLDNPSPDEEQWNFDLILEVVTWSDLADRVFELTPPPAFTEIHQRTVAAFALYDSAGEDLLRGIEDNDSELLQSGFVKWDLADDLLGDASELVNELVDERQP